MRKTLPKSQIPKSLHAVARNARASMVEAADQQPWRCTTCGCAVSHINFMHCNCTRALQEKEP